MLGVCLKYEQRNYGSKLQALATIKMFEKMGVSYEIIQYDKRTPLFYVKSLPRFFNIVFLNDRYDAIQRQIEFRRHPQVKTLVDKRNAEFAKFDKLYFKDHSSEVYRGYNNLSRNASKRYKHIITCSDQLWSPAALGSNFYNLMFASDDVVKVSWASSFGVSKIPWYQIKRTQKYLMRLDKISMRENKGAKIVEELTGRKVPVLMDPVFVFNKKEWEELVPTQVAELDENYIFCYFLGDNVEHRRVAQKLAAETGMKIVTIRHLDRYIESDESFGDYGLYDVDPVRFLNLIRNAKYVLTDSFHGCAFSIINEKQFLVFNRYNDNSSNSKNSRIDTVCDNTGLSEYRYSAKRDVYEQISTNIDYDIVREKLAKYSKMTREYLREALL